MAVAQVNWRPARVFLMGSAKTNSGGGRRSADIAEKGMRENYSIVQRVCDFNHNIKEEKCKTIIGCEFEVNLHLQCHMFAVLGSSLLFRSLLSAPIFGSRLKFLKWEQCGLIFFLCLLPAPFSCLI